MLKGPASHEGAGALDGRRYYVGERRPTEDDLAYCKRRIREEEVQAHTAGSWEAGLIHEQLAMLYRAQLSTLTRLQSGMDFDAVLAA